MRAGNSSLRWDSPLPLPLAINELSCHGKVVGCALSLLAIALYAQTLTLPPPPLPPSSFACYVYYTLICFRPASSCCHIKQLWSFAWPTPSIAPCPLSRSSPDRNLFVHFILCLLCTHTDTHIYTLRLTSHTHSVAHTFLAISWHRIRFRLRLRFASGLSNSLSLCLCLSERCLNLTLMCQM